MVFFNFAPLRRHVAMQSLRVVVEEGAGTTEGTVVLISKVQLFLVAPKTRQ